MTNEKSTLLLGRRIAILATDGFDEFELFESKKALEDAGAKVDIVSLHLGNIKAWKDNQWGKSIAVDVTVDETEGVRYDSLMIPGGAMNSESLKNNKRAIAFIREFIEDDKTIASLNPEVDWFAKEVVADEHLISEQRPENIMAFNKKMIEAFSHSSRRI